MKELANLEVAGIAVRKVEELYCLNDLHKAAGGEKRHLPSYWLETLQAKELVEELRYRNSGIINPVELIRGKGKAQGTYAVKQLVYAYAMWISPKFHLAVIEAYDALVNNQIQQAKDIASRVILKDEYRPMTDAIKHSLESTGKEPMFYHFSNEADLINRILTGMTAKQYKLANNCESVRDNLTPEGKKAMISLQRANTSMIEMGDTHQQRKLKLEHLLATRWAKQLIQNTPLIAA